MTSAQDPDASSSSSFKTAAEGLRLTITPYEVAICRLAGGARIPRWLRHCKFSNVTRTPDELSIICDQQNVPGSAQCERDWRVIKVLGTLDLSLIGVLDSMAHPLAQAQIGLVTISTYDTDYLIVRERKLADAVAVLERAGHRFEDEAADAPSDVAAPVAETAVAETAVAEEAVAEEEVPAPEAIPVVAEPFVEVVIPQDPLDDQDAAEAEQENLDTPSHWFTASQPVVPPVVEVAAPQRLTAEVEAETDQRLRSLVAETTDQPYEVQTRRQPRDKVAAALSRLGVIDVDADPESLDDAVTAAVSEEHAEPEKAEGGVPLLDARNVFGRADDVARPVAAEVEVAGDAETSEPPKETPPKETPPKKTPPKETLQSAASAAADSAETSGSEMDEEAAAGADGLYTGAIPQHDVETIEDTFESLGISGPILETVKSIGFQHPTPIQAGVIPMALEGSDIIGLAETGSGKTAAFCLPMAERLTHGRGIRGLILCPTREIALQTKAFLDIFGRDHELDTVSVIGGVKMGPQISGLRRRPDIIVATPGRLADHMRRGNVRLDALEELVLDEADHMLDLGFLPQIQEILEQVPEDRRTMMFSATMPPPIERLTKRFMRDPYRVDLRPVNSVAAGIEHRLYLVAEENKKQCLINLLHEVEGSTLVFSRRKLHTEWLARQLELAGLPVDRIHSDRSQGQRVQALRGFREGQHRILVATDVAARGIDVPRLQHVINFGMPDTVEDYVHRAGRTARGNSMGIVSSIGTWQDKITVRQIESTLGFAIPRCEVEGVEAYRELKKKRNVRRRRLL